MAPIDGNFTKLKVLIFGSIKAWIANEDPFLRLKECTVIFEVCAIFMRVSYVF